MTPLHALTAFYEKKLAAAGIYNPEADVRIILSRVLNCSREDVYNNPKRVLSESEEKEVAEAMTKRAQRIPVSRIFGSVFFRGLTLKITDGVFEPFSETEMLVEFAHMALEKQPRPLRLLDLGCGNGAVLLSLLNELPHASGLGVDCSVEAVGLSRENARALGLEGRAQFRVNDWTQGIDEQFDLLISSLPHVPSGHIKKLMPEVRTYDPTAALDGGFDGMRFYKRTLHDFHRLAKPGGVCVLQTNPAVLARTIKTLRAFGYKDVEIGENYLGLPTCVVIKRKEKEKQRLIKIL